MAPEAISAHKTLRCLSGRAQCLQGLLTGQDKVRNRKSRYSFVSLVLMWADGSQQRHVRHRGNKGGSKNQSIYVVPPLLASNTRAVYTHTHRHTNTLAHRLRAVRGNVLPYNRGYSINKLRECQIDYFFSLTVSHPSAQAYVDTHADTSTHSHCPAPPPPPECSQSASKIKL